MLSVQSPLQLAMSNDIVHEDAHLAWNAWRTPANLPTPPSSDPPRRLGTTKQPWNVGHGVQQRIGLDGFATGDQQHLSLPPIEHIDRHWPTSSPLTPPDDEMHASPLSRTVWRDAKPGPSRMHSPFTTNTSPFLASPSPSPVDEDERYDEQYEMMGEADLVDESGDRDWNWDVQQEQAQQQPEDGIEHRSRVDVFYENSRRQSVPSDTSNHTASASAVDWVTNPSQCSAHFIAEKTCEMVCYLWFSSSLGPRAAAASRLRRERERCQRRRGRDTSVNGHSPLFTQRPLSDESTAALQFSASPEFVAFMVKLLATTQVSQSVIVLSLHYIFRLKEGNDFALGKPGSEFRVAVCALMLANKFVDDNTYTNKTWSEVSAIPLEELNKMEREFLLGVGFRLYVDLQTYEAWLNLLKGLVLTKEREYSSWRERRRARAVVPIGRISDANGLSHRDVFREQRQRQQRARSTSPQHRRSYQYAPAYPFTFSIPFSSAVPAQSRVQSHSAHATPSHASAAKRTAADAFSPTSATFAGVARGGKRPNGLVLDIPAALASTSSSNDRQEKVWDRAGSVSAHPAYTYADSLHRLEKMSLVTPVDPQSNPDTTETEQITDSRDSEGQTLGSAYRGVDAARRAPPPHLYFYTLASSPLRSPYYASATEYAAGPATVMYSPANDADERVTEERPAVSERVNVLPPGAERKARLRYVDNQAGGESGYYNNTYSYGNAMPYPTSVDPIPTTTYGSSASLPSNVFAQSQLHSQDLGACTQNQRSQQMHEHQLVQQPQHQCLPPLALALSMQSAPSRASAAKTSSNTSPLPGFASFEAYAPHPVPTSHIYSHSQPHYADASPKRSTHATQAYSSTHAATYAQTNSVAPVPAVQSAWSAPPSETVDGVYAPVPRHVLPSVANYYHSHLTAPVSHTTRVSPVNRYPSQYEETRQEAATLASGSEYTCRGQFAERAAFANAGPPGIAHFYPSVRPGPSSTAEYGSAYDSNALPYAVQSSGMLQQSQSVTTSPEGFYAYGCESVMRSRRR